MKKIMCCICTIVQAYFLTQTNKSMNQVQCLNHISRHTCVDKLLIIKVILKIMVTLSQGWRDSSVVKSIAHPEDPTVLGDLTPFLMQQATSTLFTDTRHHQTPTHIKINDFKLQKNIR